MENNIPIYRAKKIDSDKYKAGQLQIVEKEILDADGDGTGDCELKYYIVYGIEENNPEFKEEGFSFINMVQVDISTLSIHFPDMIASDSDRLLPNGEKDLRIFASLQEDGRGGDIALEDYGSAPVCIFGVDGAKWKRSREDQIKYNLRQNSSFYGHIKITGIKQ